MKEWVCGSRGLIKFSLPIFGAIFSMTWPHKEAEISAASPTLKIPLWPPAVPGERALYSGAPGFMIGNQ